MAPNPTDNSPTDDQLDDTVDDGNTTSPLVILFGDHPKTKMLTALADAYPRPLNPSDIVDNAGLGSTDSWYRYREDLLNTGVIVEAGSAGNSPLYALADPSENDPRTEWLRNLRDATGAALRNDLDADAPADESTADGDSTDQSTTGQ